MKGSHLNYVLVSGLALLAVTLVAFNIRARGKDFAIFKYSLLAIISLFSSHTNHDLNVLHISSFAELYFCTIPPLCHLWN